MCVCLFMIVFVLTHRERIGDRERGKKEKRGERKKISLDNDYDKRSSGGVSSRGGMREGQA